MLGAQGEVGRARAGEVLESFDPRTGEKLGEVPRADPAGVEAAVKRARAAQADWAAAGARERNRILRRLKGVLIARGSEIAGLVSAENGKPRCEVRGLLIPLCETVDLYTRVAERLERGQKVSSTFFFGARAEIHYDPLGVAGFILPWNFPFELGVKHMIPALAAGNAVIQKPSEFNPLIGELIASLFQQAGVPEGLVQIVHGLADVGAALVDHADVVCFVGSPATGRKIMERAARTLTPVVLELGGNDAAIVRADADLELTARGLVNGACFNAGQVCNGIERIYVVRELVPALTASVIECARRLRQGGEGGYDLGPIKWPPQLAVYEAHTADALAKGATLHLGGKVEKARGGLYWPPTVLTEVNHGMRIMREETFGPFLPIMAVDGDDEAVELANDSPYGLGGSVWTRDLAAGEALARRIHAGSVMVNNAVQSGGCVTLPFGGSGDSGVGRVQGELAYFNYVAPQSLMVSPRSAKRLWMPYSSRAEQTMDGLVRFRHGSSWRERAVGAVRFLTNFTRS